MISTLFAAVLFWTLFIPALWGIGAVAGYRLREQSPLLLGVFTLALGLIVYASVLITAGLFHELKLTVVLIFAIVSLLIGGKRIVACLRWLKETAGSGVHGKSILTRVMWALLAAAFIFTAGLCFYPEVSNDALAIQLYLSKLFVKNASVSPSYLDLASYRPLFMSVLYTSGLFFNNVAIAKLFHWFCGFLLVLAAIAKIKERTQSQSLAIFFGLMLWLTPTLVNQISTTYIDAGVSLFVFLGYCLTVEKMDDLKPSDFFYGGLFMGTAVAGRYLAASACLAVAILLLLHLFNLKSDRRRIIFAGLACLGGILLTSGFWFVRAWYFTGNPVYPYLGSLFGKEDYALFSSIYFHGMGLPRSIWTFLGLPLDLTFKPQYFDYHHWIGPVYLLMLPFVIYAGIKLKNSRRPLLFTLICTFFWYFTGQNTRYLLPIFPVYLMVAAMGLDTFIKNSGQSRLIVTLLSAAKCSLLILMLGFTVFHFRYQLFPVFGVWKFDEYLPRMERTIPIARWMNQNLPASSKVLVLEEPRLFYFDQRVILDFDYDMHAHYKLLQQSAAIAQKLKSDGISYVLDMFPADESQPGNRPINAVLADPALARPRIMMESQNDVGRRYRYTLYALN